MRKKFNLLKKLALLGVGISFAVSTPMIVAACGASISQDLIDKLVSKQGGMSFSSNLSLQEGIKLALKNDNGANVFVEQIIGETILKWYEKLASDSSQSKFKNVYKKEYDKAIKDVNDSYDEAVKASKKANGSDFALRFQQDELDPHGGSEESWKKEKMIEWALTKFKDEIFANLYLSLVDSNGEYLAPTPTNLLGVLKTNSDPWTNAGNKFAFSEKALNNPNTDFYVAKQYAEFQKFIFDQWVLAENPFIIVYSMWKYGTPKEGLDKIYTRDALGSTATDAAGSYNFPYFNNVPTNTSKSTTQKFTSFVNDASGNFIVDTNTGLKEIPLGYSDSESCYKIVSNINAYSELDAQLGAASSYLFNKLATNNTSSTTPTSGTLNSQITSKTISTNISNHSLDIITSNFVGSEASKITNKTSLSEDLAKKILVNYTTSSSGSRTNGSLDIIDSFEVSDSTTNGQSANKLNQYMMLRNPEGVYAISIDGQTYIDSAKNFDEAKKKAGDIVVYRYLQNSIDSSLGLPVDLHSKLSSFFTKNFSTLVFKYWLVKNTSQEMFDFSWITKELENLINSWTTYVYIRNYYKVMENYQNSLYTNKSSLFSNYGKYNAQKNGLASSFQYEFVNSNTTNIGHYKFLENIKITSNPFGSNSANNSKVLDWSANPYDSNGIYEQFLTSVDRYVNSIDIGPLTSKFEGFKYSQYIYSDNYFINEAILEYGLDSNYSSDSIKINLILDYIKENYSGFSFNNVNSSVFNYDIRSFKINNQESKTYFESALSNEFYNSVFDSSSSKWTSYKKSSSSSPTTQTNSIPTITYSELDKYRKELWIENKKSSSGANKTEYLNFLTIVASSLFMLENNGQKLMEELKSQVSNDGSTFIVWESGIDSELTIGTSITDSKTLLYGTDGTKTYMNVNNSYQNSYYPSSNSSTNSLNTSNSFFTNQTSTFYNHVSGMNGFNGIQSQGSTNNTISDPLKKILFDNPTTYNSSKKGLLYGYASNRNDFIKMIDEYTFVNQVDDLTKKLIELFPEVTELKEVYAIPTLDEKKIKLKEIVNMNGTPSQTKKIPNEAFIPRDGFIDSNSTKTNTNQSITGMYKNENDPLSKYYYGAYVIQINKSDLKDLSTFISRITSGFSSLNNSPAGTTSIQKTNNNLAYELIANLLVKSAKNTNIQTEILDKIAEQKKVDVYDIRLNDKLGKKWAKNFKEQ